MCICYLNNEHWVRTLGISLQKVTSILYWVYTISYVRTNCFQLTLHHNIQRLVTGLVQQRERERMHDSQVWLRLYNQLMAGQSGDVWLKSLYCLKYFQGTPLWNTAMEHSSVAVKQTALKSQNIRKPSQQMSLSIMSLLHHSTVNNELL